MRQVHKNNPNTTHVDANTKSGSANRMDSVKVSLKRFFADVKKGSPIDIAILVGSVLLVVAIIALVVHLVAGTGKSGDELTSSVSSVSESYDPTANSINVSQYEGVILQENKADASYLTDTLFVGDSNTNRMITYGFTTLKNCIGVDSMSVTGVTGVNSVYFTGYSSPVPIPKAISLMQPKRIMLTFGTNNTLGDTASFKKQYTAMVNAIIDAWPYADIIINSVPPFGENRTNMNLKQSTVDSFNASLVEIAQELDDKYDDITIRYLNSAEVLKGSNGYMKEKYIDTDGVHFTRAGLDALFDYISAHAMEETEDRRPALKTIPNHEAAPLPVISEDPLAADSDGTTSVSISVSYSYNSAQGSVAGASTIGSSSVAFTVTPASGYQVASVTASSGSVSGSGSSYTLQIGSGTSGSVTVYVTFSPVAAASSATSSQASSATSSQASSATSSQASSATSSQASSATSSEATSTPDGGGGTTPSDGGGTTPPDGGGDTTPDGGGDVTTPQSVTQE